jgi:translation initiation factor 3 subunit G
MDLTAAGDLSTTGAASATLPASTRSTADADGVITITEYRINEAGMRMKTIKKIKEHQVVKKVTPEMLARASWAKFGDAKRYKAGDESMTATSLEEIFIERARLQAKSEVEKASDPLAAMASGAQTSLLVCRTCGKKGDHWTSKCPYKDLANDGVKPPEDDGTGPKRTAGGYVPPSMREGASGGAGASMDRRRDENSIRVSNLSEDTREQDLQELFRPFGPVTRIYVAFNRETGESRGFAFVNMVNRDDGDRAIAKLNGYGYDNLILHVEWAQPREQRQ